MKKSVYEKFSSQTCHQKLNKTELTILIYFHFTYYAVPKVHLKLSEINRAARFNCPVFFQST